MAKQQDGSMRHCKGLTQSPGNRPRRGRAKYKRVHHNTRGLHALRANRHKVYLIVSELKEVQCDGLRELIYYLRYSLIHDIKIASINTIPQGRPQG